MKFFITTSHELPLQNKVFILKEGESMQIIQYDNRGKYFSTVDAFDIPDGTYATDKKVFFNTIKRLGGKGFEVRATKKQLIFTKDTSEIKVNLLKSELEGEDLKQNYVFKSLPENFWRLFEKAGKIGGDNSTENTKPIFDGVRILKDKLYSGNDTTAFKGLLSSDTELDLTINSDILKVVKNPVNFALDGTNLVLTSDDGIAVLRTMDGIPPKFDRLFIDEPTTGNILGTNGLKDLNNSLVDAKEMGFNAIEINDQCELTGTMSDPAKRALMKVEYKASVNVTLAQTGKWPVYQLLTALVGDRIYCVGGIHKMRIYGSESQTLVSALRK